MLILGIDTSNYTTSVALLNTDDNSIISERMLLPVKQGEVGLRQSDAVFHHTKQLPLVISALMKKSGVHENITSIGVSVKPRLVDKSYMPCFLCGEGYADSLGAILNANVYKTSHQMGHILAGLYSIDKLDMLKKPFLSFHVSGGTTDCLLCSPSSDVIDITTVSSSLDLKAGQLIDRVGVMLGLDFPCGMEIEKLALNGVLPEKPKTTIKNGSACLSGFQNKAENMYKNNVNSSDIALYTLKACADSITKMAICAREKHSNLPIVFAGGVMSNSYIKKTITDTLCDVYFSKPDFSRDNACGVAVYARICEGIA